MRERRRKASSLEPNLFDERFSRNIRKNFFFRILISGSRVLDSLDYYSKKKVFFKV